MMLEIALEADEEWDSSRTWESLIRKAAEAAIAESAFPQLADSSRPIELSVRLAGNGCSRRCPGGSRQDRHSCLR
jgi:probable rRNA maturation factor